MSARALPLELYSQSLVFQVEEDFQQGPERRSVTGKAAAEDVPSDQAFAELSSHSCCDIFAFKVLEDVRRLRRSGQAGSAAVLAAALQQRGYRATVQRQKANSFGSSGGVQLSHEFAVVHLPGRPEPLIVEPSFREFFQIANPTPRYKALLDAAPEEVVAPFSHLSALVRLMTQEMKFAFDAVGHALPPWRSYSSILSRWSVVKAAA